jgi:hypothetical protein
VRAGARLVRRVHDLTKGPSSHAGRRSPVTRISPSPTSSSAT